MDAIEKLGTALREATEDERDPQDEVTINLTVAELQNLNDRLNTHRMDSLAPGIEPHPKP